MRMPFLYLVMLCTSVSCKSRNFDSNSQFHANTPLPQALLASSCKNNAIPGAVLKTSLDDVIDNEKAFIAHGLTSENNQVIYFVNANCTLLKALPDNEKAQYIQSNSVGVAYGIRYNSVFIYSGFEVVDYEFSSPPYVDFCEGPLSNICKPSVAEGQFNKPPIEFLIPR